MVHCAAMVATAFPKEGVLGELSHIQGRSPCLKMISGASKMANQSYYLFSEVSSASLARIIHAINGWRSVPRTKRTRYFRPCEWAMQLPANHMLNDACLS
jgi:hypothetical protein